MLTVGRKAPAAACTGRYCIVQLRPGLSLSVAYHLPSRQYSRHKLKPGRGESDLYKIISKYSDKLLLNYLSLAAAKLSQRKHRFLTTSYFSKSGACVMGAPLSAIVGAWWPVSWCWMFSRPDAVSGSQLWRQPSGQWTAGLGAQRAHLPSLSKHCKLREARPGSDWANQRPGERLVTNQRPVSYIAQCYISYRTNIDRTRIKYLHNIFGIIIEWISLFQVCLFLFQLCQTFENYGQVYYIVEWNHLSFFPVLYILSMFECNQKCRCLISFITKKPLLMFRNWICSKYETYW